MTYTLKTKVDNGTLSYLNGENFSSNFMKLYNTMGSQTQGFSDFSAVKDWVKAIDSGEKIVNPITPEDNFKTWYNNLADQANTKGGIFEPKVDAKIAIQYAAKQHPDLASWLVNLDD